MVNDPSAAPPRDLVHSLVPPSGVTRGPSDDDCGERGENFPHQLSQLSSDHQLSSFECSARHQPATPNFKVSFSRVFQHRAAAACGVEVQLRSEHRRV